MYTVEVEKLPVPERTAEAIELMNETLAWANTAEHISGLVFVGEVFCDTANPREFEVVGYNGRITSVLADPPSFNVLVDEAWRQTAECDCPYADADVFDDLDTAMEQAQISQDLDDFAETPTEDPHFEPLELAPNTEVTIRFDRLGFYGVHGVLAPSLLTD